VNYPLANLSRLDTGDASIEWPERAILPRFLGEPRAGLDERRPAEENAVTYDASKRELRVDLRPARGLAVDQEFVPEAIHYLRP
jgi:hypothetical protein